PPDLHSFPTRRSSDLSPLSTTDEKITPIQAVASYNNYYEFGTDKEDPARNAHTLKPSPWMVKVEGAVEKPQVLEIEAIKKMAPRSEEHTSELQSPCNL